MPNRVAVDEAGENCFQGFRPHSYVTCQCEVTRTTSDRVGMAGPTRPQGDSAKEIPEVDYIQRILRSLTDSATSPAQSAVQDSGMGSSSYIFIDSCGRNPDNNPGVNPCGFLPPLRELRRPNKDFSPIQREILADFPWLNEELAASAPVISKEESDTCTLADPLEPFTHQLAWARSMFEPHALEDSTCMSERVQPVTTKKQQSPFRFVDQALSNSLTTASSDTPFKSESLSSSLSDGEAELKERTRRGSELGTEAAGTSAQSGKRKRPEEEDGEDAPSDDQETSKKPINPPRKKPGVKRVREPRYAIKTRTDTEVMDDGYKWRKYGQKAVKNSPHPRNYYRCTTPNCPVRKRVERCFDDPGLVVTTYEGTHTHEVPSFLRGPSGYPGGLQGLLATLGLHYNLAGNMTPLPPSNAFPMSNSDFYQSSPMWLAQPPIHENVNMLLAHEQLLRLQQQETAWASSIKNEPGNFHFPEQGPSFSGVSSLSDLSRDTRMSSRLANASMPEQLRNRPMNPVENSSMISNGPFNSVVGLPDRSAAASSDSGLLEDMFRHTNPPSSGA